MSLSDTKRKLLQRYMEVGAAPIQPRAVTPRLLTTPAAGPALLSFAQEQMWRLEKGAPGIPLLYNECVVLRMAGPLHVRAFERSLFEIIRRHEVWRTSYEVRSGQPVQVVHPAPQELPLPV